jgi:hypothetical protein
MIRFKYKNFFVLRSLWILIFALSFPFRMQAQRKTFRITDKEYEDRVHAIWAGQMLGAMMGWPFEHKAAAVHWVDSFRKQYKTAPVDDDWYYEIVAIRAFEAYGTDMTVQQLGKQWIENSAGTWGSSEQARLLMERGVLPPDCGNPRYNKLWFTIGPQFSSDVYGALAPAMPNLAASIARKYDHINGYAEGADGGVFVAGMISLGFCEQDLHEIVRKASSLISRLSPYRKCLDMVIGMADEGKSANEIFEAVERNWHSIYPATNNAVANGGIVATCVWFGEGDFLKTVNLAFQAADFTDADCNAANAASVIGAMYGMKALPLSLVNQLGDSVVGDKMGKVMLTPPVRESITDLAKRTVAIGERILLQHGGVRSGNELSIPKEDPLTQAAEIFELSDLTKYWNPDWKLDRAGFGGEGGGMQDKRVTYLDGDVLVTYPQVEVKGVRLSTELTVKNQKVFSFDAGVDSQRVWELLVYLGNRKIKDQRIKGGAHGRKWYHITIDLAPFEGKTIKIRLFQKVFFLRKEKESGSAYWKNMRIF